MILYMLYRIPNTITPDLLHILSKMGHGDELVIADSNFPAASTSSFCQITIPIYLPTVNAPKIISDICKIYPIDHFSDYGAARMEIDNAPTEEGDVHIEVRKVLEKVMETKKNSFEIISIERQKFYSQAKNCFAVVSTGETRAFGCFILKKGVIF